MRLPTRLLLRSPDTHKGNFGHILILAGSARFSGAAVLCAQAALRSGAGLVTLGIPKSLNSAVIKIKSKEVMTLPLPETNEGTLSLSALKRVRDFSKNIDVLALGPGLGQNKSTQGLVRKVISKINKPMVIDADGLNALSGGLKIPQDTILTPHPGEMARLSGVSVKKVQSNRSEIAKRFARDYKV